MHTRGQGERRGILLVNLGTPDSPEVPAVRGYLREFLMDPRVIDLPTPARWALVHGIIAPFRGPKSAAAYRAIWGPGGSPLMVHSRALAEALQAKTTERVSLAMRYGTPSIADGIAALGEVDRIVIVPLYPQYASSTVGSVVEEVFRVLGGRQWVPPVEVVAPFWADPGFLDAQARVARPLLDGVDHVLMSFHGLPVRHIQAAAPTCQLGACCEATPPWCYRAQCLATARLLAERLDCAPDGWSVSFQSRLGRDEWLGPATEARLRALATEGKRRVLVVCPAFVSDCLETLEELGIRGAEVFREAGGEELRVAPCVNAEPGWVDALARIVG